MRCRCCLKETENDFCRTCSRKLFGLNSFCAKLDFALPDIAQAVNPQGRRISISGAQPKFSLKIEDKKLQVTDRNGGYILKPVTDMQFRLYADLPANEHVTMQMARQIFKLEVADSALLSFSTGEYAYVTKRFDVRDDGSRIHQEDFAQIAGISGDTHGSDYKYDSMSYEEIAKLMERHVSAYAVDVEKFFRIVLYNYLVCNGDAHIKNFSLYCPDQDGVYKLTPAYDLINTSLHTDDARTACDLFAEKEDYESDFYRANAFYGASDFMEFARRIGIVERRAARFIQDFTAHIPEMDAMLDISFLSDEAKAKYKDSIRDRAKALS